jgi:hypothetical protein
MRVYAAYNFDAPQYPCVIVFAASSQPISETAEWSDARRIELRVAAQVEAAAEIDGNATVTRNAREINAMLRSDVMAALATRSLLANLRAVGTEAVAFSQAQLTGPIQRGVAGRILETIFPVEIIAEPVEGT